MILTIVRDFTLGAQTVTFPVSSSAGAQMCTNIPITNDILVELTETFSVEASSNDPNVEFSVGGGDQAVVSITDNDSKRLVIESTMC